MSGKRFNNRASKGDSTPRKSAASADAPYRRPTRSSGSRRQTQRQYEGNGRTRASSSGGSGGGASRDARGKLGHDHAFASSSSRLARAPLAIVIVVVVVVALFLFVVAGRSCANDKTSIIKEQGPVASVVGLVERSIETSDTVAGITGSVGVHYDLQPLDFLAIPASSDIVHVNLVNYDSAALASGASLDGEPVSGVEVDSIREAVSAIEGYGPCGFVFVDANTGRGLAYNAATPMYIASAAKAPMAYYALMHGAGANEYARGNIESAIVDSDNDSFEGFAYDYANEEYNAWLIEHDVYHDEYYYDLYPPMSARSLASFWAEILSYIQGGSDDAKWLAGLLGSTSTSFIRDGLQGTGANVINKGGWIAEEGYASVSDAAIIEFDGHVYIMAIVTEEADWSETESNVTDLARALFDARDLL